MKPWKLILTGIWAVCAYIAASQAIKCTDIYSTATMVMVTIAMCALMVLTLAWKSNGNV